MIDFLVITEQSGDDYSGRKFGIDAIRKVDLRKHTGSAKQRNRPIDRRHREHRGGECGQEQRPHPIEDRRFDCEQIGGRRNQDGRGSQQKGIQIDRRGVSLDEPDDVIAEATSELDRSFELLPAVVQQPVADVRVRGIGGASDLGAGTTGVIDCALRDFDLGVLRTPRNPFDHRSVAVACCDVHAGIDAGRIFIENSLDDTGLADQLEPRNLGKHPEQSSQSRHTFGVVRERIRDR